MEIPSPVSQASRPSDDTTLRARRVEETEGAVDVRAEGCAEGKMKQG